MASINLNCWNQIQEKGTDLRAHDNNELLEGNLEGSEAICISTKSHPNKQKLLLMVQQTHKPIITPCVFVINQFHTFIYHMCNISVSIVPCKCNVNLDI